MDHQTTAEPLVASMVQSPLEPHQQHHSVINQHQMDHMDSLDQGSVHDSEALSPIIGQHEPVPPTTPLEEQKPVIPPLNPWHVGNLMDFSYFCCPECDYKSQNAPKFQDHALHNHPMVRL